MVYTDGIHLVADSVSELHSFARTIGLGTHWFHNSSKGKFPHYDLYINRELRKVALERAIELGAAKRTTRELVSILLSIHKKQEQQLKLKL